MDWRAGHLTTTEGTGGGAFANKNCPQGRAFEKKFKCPGYARGLPGGGMLAAGISDSHIIGESIPAASIPPGKSRAFDAL